MWSVPVFIQAAAAAVDSAIEIPAETQPIQLLYQVPVSETHVGDFDEVAPRLSPLPVSRDLTEASRFPNRAECDSPWQTGGGLPWRRRYRFGRTTTRRGCASWRS